MGAPRTAFDADAGIAQGRIRPTGWTPPSGNYVLVLGHDLPGVVRSIAPGDGISIQQSVNLAGSYYLRMRARIRAPESLPLDYQWQFYGTLAGDTIVATTITRTRELYDLSFPVGAYGTMGAIPLVLGLTLLGPTLEPIEIELPAVYIDAFHSETQISNIGLCNRDPEASDTGVPLTLPVSFMVVDPTGSSGIDPATLVVTIGGVLACSPAGGENGYALGGGLTFDTNIYAVTLTPPAPWIPLTTYEIVVQASTNQGVALSASYSWTAEDTLAPVVLEALAVDPLTVRVTFDEPVQQTGLSSALNPAAYTFALVNGAPAVTPSAIAVTAESADVYLVTLDRYATRGALYSVTVVGVEDLVGNVVTAPLDTATFTGWAWEVPEGRDIDLFRLLPESTQVQDESGEHQRFLGVLQEVFDLFFAVADKAHEVWDPDLAPEPFVDMMLAELGNPFDFPMSLHEKRRLVQTLLPLYGSKGTGPGIVRTIRLFLGIDVYLRVRAWAPYPIGVAIVGDTFVLGTDNITEKYTFEIHCPVILTAEQRAILREIVDVMIVAHEHYRLIEPDPFIVYDHWYLGASELTQQTYLH